MDTLPKDIISVILGWLDGEPKRNYSSTCRLFYQWSLAAKSKLIINALPINDLDSFQNLLNRANAQIELFFEPQANAMKSEGPANKLFDMITKATNITGLSLCEWKGLEQISNFEQILQMTSLQKLLLRECDLNFVLLKWTNNLQKLTRLEVYNTKTIGDWHTLTNLQDLTIQWCNSTLLESFLTNVSSLTKLHIKGLVNDDVTTFNIVLTTLSNLKDLKIQMGWDSLSGPITASCTTLEAFDIDFDVDIDINWLSSNTRLTHLSNFSWFKVGDPHNTALANLQKVAKMTFGSKFNPTQLLPHFELTDLSLQVDDRQIFIDVVQNYTSLRKLRIPWSPGIGSMDILTSLSHLTLFECGKLDPSYLPTTLKELSIGGKAKNLSQLTRLEYLYTKQRNIFSEVEHLTRLTGLFFLPANDDFMDNKEVVEKISNLSNLSNLRELLLFRASALWSENRTYAHAFNLDCLTSLTNLEKLDCQRHEFDMGLLNTLHSLLTRLTSLGIKQRQPDSDGEILGRFTKLRRLELRSIKKDDRYKMQKDLETKLPHVTVTFQ